MAATSYQQTIYTMKNWQWFHRFGSPKWFLEKSYPWSLGALFLGVTCLLTGAIWGLFFAPPDYQQGDAFRIIYVHVPAAILAQSIYLFIAISYLVGWVWKIKIATMAAQSAIVFGMGMTVLALITGSAWGKPIWGTYWVWDARLTSMLILFILYLGLFLLQRSFSFAAQAERMSAILSLVGLINIPIIKYSVDWWHTLHQSATFTITESPAMPAVMWLPLLFTVISYYSLLVFIVVSNVRTLIIKKQIRALLQR